MQYRHGRVGHARSLDDRVLYLLLVRPSEISCECASQPTRSQSCARPMLPLQVSVTGLRRLGILAGGGVVKRMSRRECAYLIVGTDETVALRGFTLSRHAPLGIEKSGGCNLPIFMDASAVFCDRSWTGLRRL